MLSRKTILMNQEFLKNGLHSYVHIRQEYFRWIKTFLYSWIWKALRKCWGGWNPCAILHFLHIVPFFIYLLFIMRCFIFFLQEGCHFYRIVWNMKVFLLFSKALPFIYRQKFNVKIENVIKNRFDFFVTK